MNKSNRSMPLVRRITDEGLLALPQLPELSQLDLTATRINGHGLAALEKCPKLKELKLSYTLEMTQQGWEALSKLTQLEALDVSFANTISDADVAKLTLFTKLRKLNLSETPITDEVFQSLAEMESLEILTIEGNSRLNGRGLQAYVRAKPVLRELHASHTPIVIAGLRHLKTISSLEFLDISVCNLSDQQFAELRGANNLVHLKVGGNFLTNAGMQIVMTMGKLKILDLSGMPNLSDPALGILAKKNSLTSLNVKNTAFTPQAIQQFQRIRKNCEVLH